MYCHACFYHSVCVNFEFFVVSPLKVFEMIGLETHCEHVIICESKVNECVCRVFDVFPRDFVLYKVLWKKTLIS